MLAQQQHEMIEVARRFSQCDRQVAACAIGGLVELVFEFEREFAHRGLACRQPADQLHQQPARREQQGLGLFDACEQFELGMKFLGRREPGARIGRIAIGAVEFVEQGLAEPARQTGARQKPQLAQAGGADADQGVELGLGCIEHLDRQGIEGLQGVGAIGRGGTGDGCLREQPGAGGGRKTGELGAQAEFGQGVAHRMQQGLGAAEQAQAGLHLKQQSGLGAEFGRNGAFHARNGRGEAHERQRSGFDGLAFTRGVAFDQVELRA